MAVMLSSLILVLPAVATAKATEVFDFGKVVATGICKLPGFDPIVSFPKWGKDMLPDQPKMALGVVDAKEGLQEFTIRNLQSIDASDKPNRAKDLVSVQALFCPHYFTKPPDGQKKLNVMWILDAGKAPGEDKIEKDAAKLYRVGVHKDGKSGVIERQWTFDKSLVPDGSYLNDVRIDKKGYAYITDSNSGTMIVYDLKSRRARLFEHPGMQPQINAGESFKIGDKDLASFKVAVDGVAYSEKDDAVYWKPVTRTSLFRTSADLLREGEQHGMSYAEEQTEDLGAVGFHDGLDADSKGNVYLTDLVNGAIQRRDKRGQITYISEKGAMPWPDAVVHAEGHVYVLTSQVHLMPFLNDGKDMRKEGNKLYKIPDGTASDEL